MRAYQSSADGDGWEAWRQYLLGRRLRPVAGLLGSSRSPLSWSVPSDEEFQPALELIEDLSRLGQSKRRSSPAIDKRAARWLAAAETAPCTGVFALECLAWCWALPMLTEQLDEQLWWRMLNHLAAIAKEPEQPPQGLLARQLLSGELALALAYLFPEITDCHALAQVGRRTVTGGIREALNGRGVPNWQHLDILRLLLACWTRCRALGGQLQDGWGGQSLDRQFRGFVQHALRLSRPDGKPVFATSGAPTWDPDLLKVATRVAGQETQRLARLTTVGRATPRKQKGLPPSAFENEAAGIAQFRSDWSRPSPQLTVVYGGPEVQLELSVGPRLVWSGPWDFEVQFDGQPATPQGDWEQTCWQSDEDLDYLELSIECSHGITVERHLLLLREDRVLFLADVVLGDHAGKIEYRGLLPLAETAHFEGEAESREGTLLVGKSRLGRVLPLALGEWRAEPALGELQQSDGALELALTSHRPRLFAPLFFDLETQRLRREITWRQLTVAEERLIVPPDVAVGYRVQSGDDQWLIYRSLAEPAIRSLLAKSLMHQFFFGSVPSTGRVETLLEIESTAD